MRVGATAPIGPMANVGEERQMGEEGVADSMEREESIAEGMMSLKKLQALQQGVSTLQKTSRTHHEMVVRLEKAMSDTISENDLRRAIGLALEEFDSQLTEAFRDSGRKALAVFAKSEDVVEMQSKIDKKVNFEQYNSVLQKLSDLRKYIDTMAESVFIGHQESQEEFAKEAHVEKSLKLKADLGELTEVRSKLERLESIVNANDVKHNAFVDELREQVTKSNAHSIQNNRHMIEKNKEVIAQLQEDGVAIHKRVNEVESHFGRLSEDSQMLHEKQDAMQERQDGVIWRACQSLQGLCQGMDGKVSSIAEDLNLLGSKVEKFQDFASERVQQLFDNDEQLKEQVRFLMEASEMLKRRSREFNKTHASQLKELKGSESKITEHIASLERSFKANERDLRAIEKRIPHGLSMLAAAEPLPPTVPDPLEPNERLQNVLAHLEIIASGQPGPPKPTFIGSDSKGATDQDGGFIPALPGLQTGLSLPRASGVSPRLPATSPRPPSYGSAAGLARTQLPKRATRS